MSLFDINIEIICLIRRLFSDFLIVFDEILLEFDDVVKRAFSCFLSEQFKKCIFEMKPKPFFFE